MSCEWISPELLQNIDAYARDGLQNKLIGLSIKLVPEVWIEKEMKVCGKSSKQKERAEEKSRAPSVRYQIKMLTKSLIKHTILLEKLNTIDL